MKRITAILLTAFTCLVGTAQTLTHLPLWNTGQQTFKGDWLIDGTGTQANIYQTDDGRLVLSNGITARFFSVTPNGATVGLDLLTKKESFIRSVRPEAEIMIDGMKFSVGGLTGQPVHNYLLPAWLAQMEADPASFRLV